MNDIKTLENIFNNQFIKKDLRDRKAITTALDHDYYKIMLTDQRNTIKVLATDTNNDSMIVLYRGKTYYIEYNWYLNNFMNDNKYHIEKRNR
jgi:hypothetical protein